MKHVRLRRPYWIPQNAPAHDFPPIEGALDYPDGLLAIGGDLSLERLLTAYRRGIFPWYSEDQPLLWWSPNPRLVLFPEQLKVSRSLRKNLRNGGFSVSFDRAFDTVIRICAETMRPDQEGTWITPDMQRAYSRLHRLGFAHSVECWYADELVGGLYGIAIGRVFFGESMFTRRSNASKVAFVVCVRQLQRWGYELIDCQVHTEHLGSLGAVSIPRGAFKRLLEHLCGAQGAPPRAWPHAPDAEVFT